MSTNQLNKKITSIQKKVNNREVGRTGRERIKNAIAETPLSLVRANAMYSRRKLLFSGNETSRGYSSGEERQIDAALPMEQDEVLTESYMFVRGEDDVTYFPLKIQEPTTAKIKEEVADKFELEEGAIKDIEFGNGSKSIDVRNDDGTLQKRGVRHGDRLFMLKRKADDPESFILVELGSI